MAELDQRYYSLASQKSVNEGQQESLQSDMDDIDSQIKSLQAAYDEIDVEKELLKDQRSYLRGMPTMYEGSWKGAHASVIFDACNKGGQLDGDYTTYINAIDEIEDSINEKIRELKDKKAEKWGILQGLIQAWNYIYTEMRNYFN